MRRVAWHLFGFLLVAGLTAALMYSVDHEAIQRAATMGVGE